MTATWATIEDVQAAWPDALLDEEQLQRLLDAAQEALEEYAPVLAEDAPVPARYTEALILHVREIWRSGEREAGDLLGIGDYAVRARDMTAAVKALLRPKKARVTPR